MYIKIGVEIRNRWFDIPQRWRYDAKNPSDGTRCVPIKRSRFRDVRRPPRQTEDSNIRDHRVGVSRIL